MVDQSAPRGDNSMLDAFLHRHTVTEDWHLSHPGEPSPRYASLPKTSMGDHECYLFDWRGTLAENPVGLIKETRFTTVPAHVNRDMELSMVYEGSCDFVVAGSRRTLHEGDVIILDTDVERSSPSYKDEGDIVLSMVFRRAFFDSVLLGQLPGASLLTALVFDSISDRRKHDRYLVVPARHAGRAPMLMRVLMEEYYFSDLYSAEIIRGYATCLLLELIRGLYKMSAPEDGDGEAQTSRLERILGHIERNVRDCTLASTAKAFGYSPNYLGSLLKRETGHSFSEVKLTQQMSEASFLLLNTTRPITEVARKVGISNMTYFYRKFSERFGVTPREFRDQMSAR